MGSWVGRDGVVEVGVRVIVGVGVGVCSGFLEFVEFGVCVVVGFGAEVPKGAIVGSVI